MKGKPIFLTDWAHSKYLMRIMTENLDTKDLEIIEKEFSDMWKKEFPNE